MFFLRLCKTKVSKPSAGSDHSPDSAGLWEFPATMLSEGTSKAERTAAVTTWLQSCLERLGYLDNILSTARRKPLGTVTHVFSHINMTLLVEHLVIKVRSTVIPVVLASIWFLFVPTLCMCQTPLAAVDAFLAPPPTQGNVMSGGHRKKSALHVETVSRAMVEHDVRISAWNVKPATFPRCQMMSF